MLLQLGIGPDHFLEEAAITATVIFVMGWLFLQIPLLLQWRASASGFSGRWTAVAVLRATLLYVVFPFDESMALGYCVVAALWFYASYWLYHFRWSIALREGAGLKTGFCRFIPESLYLLAELPMLVYLLPAVGTREPNALPLVAWLVLLVLVLIRGDRRRREGTPIRTPELLAWAAIRAGALVALSFYTEESFEGRSVFRSIPLFDAVHLLLIAVPPIYLYQLITRSVRVDAPRLRRSFVALLTAIGSELLIVMYLWSLAFGFLLVDFLDDGGIGLIHIPLLVSWLLVRAPLILLKDLSGFEWLCATVVGVGASYWVANQFLAMGFYPAWGLHGLPLKLTLLYLFAATSFTGSALYRRELLWRARAGMEH